MDQVAPFAVQRLLSQPEIITETCNLLDTTPGNFVETSFHRILPDLFANGEQRILDAILTLLPERRERTPANLFLVHPHSILAHIFLLPTQAQTNKGLNFVTQVVRTAAKSSTIDIQSVLKTCLVPLLAELVVVMGDVEETVARQVSPQYTFFDFYVVSSSHFQGNGSIEESRKVASFAKEGDTQTL